MSIEQGGLLQSDDAGATWTEFQGFYEDVYRMVSPPARPERMFITGGKGMWLSEDAGGRWEHHDGMPIAYADGLVIHPERNELMFCSGAGNVPSQWPRLGTAGTSIVRSRDSGRTWERLTEGLPERQIANVEAMSLHVWPEGCSVFAATADGKLFTTDDEGDTWRAGGDSTGGQGPALPAPAGRCHGALTLVCATTVATLSTGGA